MKKRANFKYDLITQDFPEKIFIEREQCAPEYSPDDPGGQFRLDDILFGHYSRNNFRTLFESLPEIYAPINEIASRVADARWQLKRYRNDEIVWNDENFNRLFSRPNPFQEMRDFVREAVINELIDGFQAFHLNYPSLMWRDPSNILTWTNLPHGVKAKLKTTDPHVATEISDIVEYWESDKGRRFDVSRTIPIFNLGKKGVENINSCISYLQGAEKAIKNLIPVYEARGMIYIKRGAMGFIVSNKNDASGKVALSAKSKREIREEYQKTYGLKSGKAPIAITDQPIDFVRTSMSIQELEPFTETLLDATAIYKTLRVPSHLIPRVDHSTFNNAKADMIDFYNSVIIPWAGKYADIWTKEQGWVEKRKYIFGSFEHIDVLQEDKVQKAQVLQISGNVYYQRWTSGIISLNEWIEFIDGTPGSGDIYEKKYFELSQKQIDYVKNNIISSRANGSAKASTKEVKGGTNQLS